MQLSDESLMSRVARGDRNALEILYDRYAARVLGFALQIVGERATAEELLQETFWQVWQSAANFESQHRSFTSWLFMILRNLPSPGTALRDFDHQSFFETIQEASSLDPGLKAEQLKNSLRSLPHDQRQVIEMAYFQGMTRQEIATSMGQTLDTISSLARLGLQNMRQALERNNEIE